MITQITTSRATLTSLFLLLMALSLNSSADAQMKENNSHKAVKQIETFLSANASSRPEISGAEFATTPLTKVDANKAFSQLWKSESAARAKALQTEWEEKVVKAASKEMKFDYRVFGKKPEGGWSLFISMHGGGGTATRVNDSQWRNQIMLYQPDNAIYVAPRAPTDAWNLWHQSHIDPLFERLIEGAILTKDVNPNKVYIMGYSAGGDGVYQLAPRMADYLAGACMMAGHPNGANPLGLRNIGFSIDVGALDAAYKRNTIAVDWGKNLANLQAADPEGYKHIVNVRKGMPHWMNRKDAESVKWISKFTREPLPKKIIWVQDDVTHSRFYWLAVPKDAEKKGTEIWAERTGQTIAITKTKGIDKMIIRLNDKMLDLDKEVTITWEGKEVFKDLVPRTIATISKTLQERMDSTQTFCAEVLIERKAQ